MSGPSGFTTVQIKTIVDGQNEPNIKQYFEYDGEGNTTGIYYAQANASGNERCLKQVFEYTTVSGQKQVQKIGWVRSAWNTNWNLS